MDCHIDIETFSEVDLPKAGAYRYAEHSSTELLVLCYRFGATAPVHAWIPRDTLPDEAWPTRIDDVRGPVKPGKMPSITGRVYLTKQMPADLEEHMRSGKLCRAHNANFERVVLNGAAGEKLGVPKTPIQQWRCTMAKAHNMSLPGALGKAAQAMGVHRKDEDGRSVMLQLAKPRRPSKTDPSTRFTPESHPLKFRVLYDYCGDDVLAESGLDVVLPELSAVEQQVWFLDQEINDRGVRIDVPKARSAAVLRKKYQAYLTERTEQITDGVRPTQTGALAEWVRGQGVPIENLQADTVRDLLAHGEALPPRVRAVLEMRLVHESKAPAKYEAMLRAVCDDGRLRGMFQYGKAGTGRWSSTIVQLHNMSRDAFSEEDGETQDTAIDAYPFEDLEYLRMLYPNLDPMQVLSRTVRGMLIPEDDCEFIVADYVSIEGRKLAWLAGQEDKLEVFRTHGKVYEYTGAKMSGLPLDLDFLLSMKKTHPEQRQAGKVGELAFGYQGGVGAVKRMARHIPEVDAERYKNEWREANRRIVDYWYALEELAAAAVMSPGTVYRDWAGRVMFKVEGRFLLMRLPSSRRVAYLDPAIDEDGKVTYTGIDTFTRQWCRVRAYGGKWAENLTQSSARDVLIYGMLNLQRAGYPLVLHVHDEDGSEVRKGTGARWSTCVS
jgi:DNA polymerase